MSKKLWCSHLIVLSLAAPASAGFLDGLNTIKDNIITQVVGPNVSCEKLHVETISELTTIVQTLPDPVLQDILINGSSAQTDLFSLEEADQKRMGEIVKPRSEEMKKLIAKANCTSSIVGLEVIKAAFAAEDFEKAIATLNFMGGLKGVSEQLNEKINPDAASIDEAATVNGVIQ